MQKDGTRTLGLMRNFFLPLVQMYLLCPWEEKVISIPVDSFCFLLLSVPETFEKKKKKPLGVGSHRRIVYGPGTYVAQETKEQLVADISEDRYSTRGEVELR